MAQLGGQLVVDERGHVDVLAVTRHRVTVAWRGQGGLHLVDAAVDIGHLALIQVIQVRRLVLEQDHPVLVGHALAVHRVIMRGIGGLVVTIHLHQVVARQFIAALAGAGQIQAVTALGNHLAQDIHAIVGAVKEKFAITATRGEFHPRTHQFIGEQVTHHALVGIGGHQRPVVILAHSQDFSLLFGSIFQRTVQRAERIRLLGRVIIGRIAAVTQGNMTLVVDALTGVGRRVGIIELTRAVIDDFHHRIDAFIAVNDSPLHLKPHDGQVGRGEFNSGVVRREIHHLMLAGREREHQHHYENQSLHFNFNATRRG